ncbi:MAG: hypothetical protein U0840_28160 [Gemmataceae bacterium]
MRFALVGEHRDGVNLALALVESGRHQVVRVSVALEASDRARLNEPRLVSDLEEILADPEVEAVLVAEASAQREEQVRRALQAERHVVCIHAGDAGPEGAYEASLIQGDTKRVLLPLLPWVHHPAVLRWKERIDQVRAASTEPQWVLTVELRTGETQPGIDWWLLRQVGGEIQEVSAQGGEESAAEPMLVAGRFVEGGWFQVTVLPGFGEERVRLRLGGLAHEAELFLPVGLEGPAYLTWREAGRWKEEAWPAWDPWPTYVEQLERALAGEPAEPTWQDEVRARELGDATRRSRQRRQVQTLEYAVANEEVGFKGTMALTGCALLWVVLGLAVVSRWLPAAGWLIVPLLVSFIGLQVLRWVIPTRPETSEP